jgi:hypothetical protein
VLTIFVLTIREDVVRVSFPTKPVNGVLGAGLCAALFAGCGGDGARVGTSAALPQSQGHVLTTQSANAAQGNVTFSISVTPKTKDGRRTPKYVSPSSRSLQILTGGENLVVVNLTSSSPSCLANPAVPGTYVCTASLHVLAGNHVFTVTTYDLSDAKGSVLSTNTTGPVFVKPTGTTTVSIVLRGIVQYVILALATTNPPIGKAVALPLTAILEDADQNLIVGPAPYEYPVTLTTTDPVDAPLSKTDLNSPADVSGITANYSGANVASISYSATATGLPAAGVVPVELMPGAPAKHLYAVNFCDGVSVFDVADPTATPTMITDGLMSPTGLALDASGKLYVANSPNSNPSTVSVFDTAHGNAVLPAIATGRNPQGVTVDASGKLYVANYLGDDSLTGSISVFDTVKGVALPEITGGGISYPLGVAVDASGKLYVANATASVSVFDTAHGNAVLPMITGGGLSGDSGVAIDARGKLYVTNADPFPGQVLIFDTANGNAVLPPITGGGLYDPQGVAIDVSGKLYVANPTGEVTVFDTAHGNVALPPFSGRNSCTSGQLGFPEGVAIH